jgi:hypothetical protein
MASVMPISAKSLKLWRLGLMKAMETAVFSMILKSPQRFWAMYNLV